MIPHKENPDEWTWSAYCNDFEKINKQQMYIMFANLQIETHKNAYIVTNTCKQKKMFSVNTQLNVSVTLPYFT